MYTRTHRRSQELLLSKVASELGNSAALAFLKEHEPKRIATIPTGKGRSCYPNGSYHSADIVRRRSNEVEILVEGPGWLVLSEVWAPGWGAYVDGSRERVYRTNVAFLSLPLSEGMHHIEFTYNPSGWRWGRWISLGKAIAMLLGTIIAVYKQRTQSTRQFR